MSRKVALFGGSFNPPHIGHVMATEYLLSSTEIDQVWWLPVYRHAFPHKQNTVSFEHRFQMCTLSISPFGERAHVVDVERTLGGTNRTIDTLEYLMPLHPETAFRLVVGADIFKESDQWKEFGRLQELAPFIVLARTGHTVPEGHEVSPPLSTVSSSDIRQRIAVDQSLDGQLPPGVENYIHAHALYRGDTGE